MNPAELQQTIAQPANVSGRGYWSGAEIRVEFRPAPPNAGVTFVRRDKGPDARVPARMDLRVDAPRRTNLRHGDVQVEMVEHVLAALAGLQIDNCEVHVDQAEMPGCDGSAAAFVEAIERAGVVRQGADAAFLEIVEPVRLTDGDRWIEARPAKSRHLVIEYRLEYPSETTIGRQAARAEITPSVFRNEIAGCRTFLLEAEAKQLQSQGLAAHVTPQDLLVFGDSGPIENRLRFNNECARHKLLDVLGDLALTGARVVGEITAHRSGHRLHVEFAKKLAEHFQRDAAVAPRLHATA